MILDMSPVPKILYLPKLELGLDLRDWLWANNDDFGNRYLSSYVLDPLEE